jgi:hypothetical protein
MNAATRAHSPRAAIGAARLKTMQMSALAVALLLAVGCSKAQPGHNDDGGSDDSGGDTRAGDRSDEASVDAPADSSGGDTSTGDRPDDVGIDVDTPADTGGGDSPGDVPPSGHGLILGDTVSRSFIAPARCDVNGACSTDETCFRLTADIALCDRPQPIAATTCGSGGIDSCACNGLSCTDAKVCINVEDDGSGGVFDTRNVCVDTACTSPSDCAAGTACTPSSFILPNDFLPGQGRCLEPLCETDADCVDGNEGSCALIMQWPVQNGQLRILAVRCAYRGSFDPTAPPDQSRCAGTLPRGAFLVDPAPTAGDSFYYCPRLPR